VKGVAFHGCCLLIVEAWALRHGCQKNTYGAEQPFGTIVDSHAPGEAPQPLTLNHSASDPGCSAVGVHSFEGFPPPVVFEKRKMNSVTAIVWPQNLHNSG
jgi:hypothetical protein